jgi:uncharacterized protein (TIGR03032 family)
VAPVPSDGPLLILATVAASPILVAESLRGAGGGMAERIITLGDSAGLEALVERVGAVKVILVAANEEDPDPPELTTIEEASRLRVQRDRLLADPRRELGRVCEFIGIRYDQRLLTPLEAARRAELQQNLAEAAPSPFASVSTASFAAAVAATGGSLLISTYQTNRLVTVRATHDELNTHFRVFDKPMGLAHAPGRIAIGARTEVWDYRDVPAAVDRLEGPTAHDACFVPRNRHVTGDIAVHDLAFASGELWLVATAFSCLATLDADHSFVPRWAPPFITELQPEDRCHLNGLAVADDHVTHVTAFSTTNDARGWRADRATGGVLIDVASGEVVISGLSMPHSPRWHGGRLWLLESGRGTLAHADPSDASVETVAELPGFTRGLAFAGETAFVGLSQIRETATFGDLPVTERLQERQAGVWMVDLRTGQIAGFLRFEDLVQEIFDVAVLPGKRFPEIAEPAGPLTDHTYVLP